MRTQFNIGEQLVECSNVQSACANQLRKSYCIFGVFINMHHNKIEDKSM